MKRLNLLFLLSVFTMGSLLAQNNANYEVLYFKANLACCQAKACDALQKDVAEVFESNFDSKDVSFTVVKLEDDAKQELIDKYNAKSQTVVCVKSDDDKGKSVDLSPAIRQYKDHKDKEKLVAQIKGEIVKLN
ncbi:MAG: hypothetical protein ACOCXO_04225 [Bacteroidota bacterium]